MTYTPNTPWVDGSGGGTPLSAARLNNMEAGISPVYASYTPTWASSGTAPVIGNGVFVAQWLQIGKLVHFFGTVTFGSSSTFGSGTYTFTLPVTASVLNPAGGVFLFDSSASNYALATAFLTSSTAFQITYGATYLGALTHVGASAPWTWATSDQIGWNLTYEAA